MHWPLKIEDAFNIVRPLTPEERQQMMDIAIDLAERSQPITIIQDSECPRCLNCGQPLDIKGVCQSGCGRVKKEQK